MTFASSVSAQTWVGPRQAPSLTEISAIDETGEDGWPYGPEDVAGDGIDVFDPPEQSIDVRTAYAAAFNNDLWVRAYFSTTMALDDDVSLFVFIDSDENENTGGTAVAPEIDPRFDADPTPGGYEYVVGVRSDETVLGVWMWSETNGEYELLPAMAQAQVTPETGVELDPIVIGTADRGYLQVSVPLSTVGLDSDCNALLFYRSLTETMTLGAGDLDVGLPGECRPESGAPMGTPPVVVPPPGCTSDDQCPGRGICIDGDCYVPPACIDDGDCAAGEECSPDGICVVVPDPAATCTDDADCNGLVCDMGMCVACTGDASCSGGARCAPTGICIVDATGPGTGGSPGTGGGAATGGTGTGGSLPPGEKVQGGAFTCGVAERPGPSGWPAALLALCAGIGLSLGRRRHRTRALGSITNGESSK